MSAVVVVVVVGKVDGLNLREQECLEGWREPDVDADSCVIPPRITRGGLVKCFSGGEGKALLLTTNGQGQKERINSRFARNKSKEQCKWLDNGRCGGCERVNLEVGGRAINSWN